MCCADQRADLGLHRGERRRHAQLQVEVTMVQRANRHTDGGALILSGQRSKPGHARDHERPTGPTCPTTPRPAHTVVISRAYDGTSRFSPFRLSSNCI